MQRFALVLATLAALLVPTTPAIAAAAPADGESTIPPELCLAVLGTDFERLFCSS